MSRVLTEDEFYKQFKPITHPDGSDFWGNFKDIVTAGIPVERIWSAVDGEGGDFLLPGCHVVNVYAHMVTEVPWTEDIEHVFLDSINGEDEE